MLRRIVVIAAAIITVCADRPQAQPQAQPAGTVAIRAGRLIDPETGTSAANQIILVQGERITAIGADVAIPPGAQVIDLSKLTVLPGLVDAHTHQAITYKEIPENNIYYFTFVNDSTALRAIQAASNAMQLLGIRIHGHSRRRQQRHVRRHRAPRGDRAGMDARADDHSVGPHHRHDRRAVPADAGDVQAAQPRLSRSTSKRIRHDEIVKAVRENLLFGAKTIKICVDCKPWGYSVEDIKLFIAEAAKGGAKVDGHVQTREGGQRAIDAGIHVISHGQRLTPEQHAQMAKKTIYLASTDTPFTPYRGSDEGQKQRSEAAQERVGERGADHLLDRHGLLERSDEEPGRHVDGPRRADDQLPVDLEGGGHSARKTRSRRSRSTDTRRPTFRTSAVRSRWATTPT